MNMTMMQPTYTRTPEEEAKRLRIRQLRELISGLAQRRREIKGAYRLNHQAPEYCEALARLCQAYGIKAYPWSQHCTPARDQYRAELTALHCELAELRGKRHLQEA